MLWHTVFDASAAFNAALSSEDEHEQLLGIVIWLVVFVVSVVLQFAILIRFKKNTEKYCAMELQDPAPDSAPDVDFAVAEEAQAVELQDSAPDSAPVADGTDTI